MEILHCFHSSGKWGALSRDQDQIFTLSFLHQKPDFFSFHQVPENYSAHTLHTWRWDCSTHTRQSQLCHSCLRNSVDHHAKCTDPLDWAFRQQAHNIPVQLVLFWPKGSLSIFGEACYRGGTNTGTGGTGVIYKCIIINSQNNLGWRDFWRSPSQTPCPKQAQLDPLAQEFVS